LLRLILVLWILQLVWLAWLLREEIVDVPQRLRSHSWGQAIRREDPFHRWLGQVDRVIPPQAIYIFLDNYEAGKEIEARYHLFPRQHLLIQPQVAPSLLFHIIRHEQPSYLLMRDSKPPLGPGLKAALDINAAEPLPHPGPGLVLGVKPDRIAGGFYD
jgi:hypothetical protein